MPGPPGERRWVGVPITRWRMSPTSRTARSVRSLQERAHGRLGPLAAAEDATVALGVNVSDWATMLRGRPRPPPPVPPSPGGAGFTNDPIAPGPDARTAHLGQACGGLLGLAPARRHAGHAGPAAAVEAAEAVLRALGFGQLARATTATWLGRGRDARARAMWRPAGEDVVAVVRTAGFRFVAPDLEGSVGSLNRGLRAAGASEEEP